MKLLFYIYVLASTTDAKRRKTKYSGIQQQQQQNTGLFCSTVEKGWCNVSLHSKLPKPKLFCTSLNTIKDKIPQAYFSKCIHVPHAAFLSKRSFTSS